MEKTNAKVVICFHFSIFEPLETTDLSLSIVNQQITQQIRIKNGCCFKEKIPLLSGIFLFKTVLTAALEYSPPLSFYHKTVRYFQTAYP